MKRKVGMRAMEMRMRAATACGVALVSGFLAGCASSRAAGQEGKGVEMVEDQDGVFQLRVDGKPFHVKGVAGTTGLERAAARGANSFRTWGIEDIEQRIEGKPLLDYAYGLGMRAAVGLWVEHERHGFSYRNKDQIARQRARIRANVNAYKNHPGVLVWGLGNEMEGLDYTEEHAYIWDELNELARMVKEEDPNHPVMTVIALPLERKIRDIQTHYPELDILGINAYGGAVTIPDTLRAAQWNRPVMLTEFGPHGQWEVGKTAWGAPIEPTSTEKAVLYLKAYDAVRNGTGSLFLGSYTFFWGSKHEATPTWYGMFLESGEKVASVDVVTEVWTGVLPENRCPIISSIEWSAAQGTVSAGSIQQAKVVATDPENDAMEFEWVVMAENAEYKPGGDKEATPPTIPGLVLEQEQGRVVFKAPTAPGAYRLYVYVRDGNGGAATANTPFFVEPAASR